MARSRFKSAGTWPCSMAIHSLISMPERRAASLDGQAGALAGFLDAFAEESAPDLAAHIRNEGRGKGGKLWHAHILTTPETATLSSKSRHGIELLLEYVLSAVQIQRRLPKQARRR